MREGPFMTNVEYDPYEKIIIKSYIPFKTPKEFAENMIANIPPGVRVRLSAFWANGVVFKHYPFYPTESISNEYLKGNLYIDHVEFAPMKTFQKEIIVNQEAKINVLDVSKHTVFSLLTDFIAKHLLTDL